ncbi:arginine biosynthesis bifunctional protein ArgJ, chloroplastic-like [Papaver somniferum]|uniref:arginine biosynthesis bifunctional protein ArgJ, chloroplastic-like n=1 Tax=Papaver somniferum TaxID=3469 RepID=UPI000E702FA8|nr:arginine biosynthesis bifunctional protein ArgJ, chloroplastic-like [Papaver somniferum]
MAACSLHSSISIRVPELNHKKLLKSSINTSFRRGLRVCAVSSNNTTTMLEAAKYIPAAPILLPEGPWEQIPGGVTAAKGFKAAGMYGGLRAKGQKPDLALVTCDVDAVAAGVFTLNVVAAAPVLYCRNVLDISKSARAVLVNAGQANAATGDLGYQDVIECASAVAKLLHLRPEEVLIESTGVIGQRIKKDALLKSLPSLIKLLSSTTEGADAAAVAITTTDLVCKSVAAETEVGGTKIRVGGMAKGSGMIHPNMATMLGVVTTDALVTSDVWRKMVKTAVNRSFNQITVDGDSSTNDTVIALASGISGSTAISSLDSFEATQLQACLDAVMQGLAKSIAWDGEGATCLIEVTVTGATNEADAAKVARSVAASSLVKAAVYGRDPNWGRIACGAGYAGVPFSQNELRIALGDILLMDGGQPLPFDRDAASDYLKGAGETHGTVEIHISIGNGQGRGQAWGCDLSYDYVKINAEYTT